MKIYYPGTGPAGCPELRLDQIEALYRIKREITDPKRSKGALVGAGMGSGKTVVSVEVVRQTNPNRVLIVGVRNAFSQWEKTFKEQGVTRPLLRIDKTISGKRNLMHLLVGDSGIFYVGLEMLRAQDWERVSETPIPYSESTKEMLGEEAGDFWPTETKAVQRHTFSEMDAVDLLISDESHRHSSQKSASIKTMRDIPAIAKVALSGTFFGNKFENAWPLTCWIWDKKTIGGKSRFEAEWCVKIPVMTKDGRKQLKTASGYPISKIIGERDPGEFVESLPCYVFIATPIGPVPAPEVITVPLGLEQTRQYNEMQDQSLTWIPAEGRHGKQPLVADLPIVQRIRLRTAALGAMTLIPRAEEGSADSITFAKNCKSTTLDAAYDVLHRPTWVGRKALILTHSKPFAEEVARRINQKYSVALKTGDVTSQQWEVDKARFMLPVSETTSVQYLVAVISAVGTATDGLQANCAKVLWLSEDENNTNNMQGANRVWREGVNLPEYESVKIVQEGTIAEGVLAKNDQHGARVLDSVAGLK